MPFLTRIVLGRALQHSMDLHSQAVRPFRDSPQQGLARPARPRPVAQEVRRTHRPAMPHSLQSQSRPAAFAAVHFQAALARRTHRHQPGHPHRWA